MSEAIKISTSKYIKSGKVDIDGNLWTVHLPGAGTELRFSQASRRAKLYAGRIENIDEKMSSGNVSDEELDLYEEYLNKYEEAEKTIYGVFSTTFKDGTKDNSQVNAWLEETPLAIISLAFEEVKSQANEKQPIGATPTDS